LSGVVFALDGVFLLLFVLATRTSFRVFRALIRPAAPRPEPAFEARVERREPA
jgi:hypothetical protein